MKNEELCNKMHTELFSTSSHVRHTEQLMNGEGPFECLFDRVPIKSHGLNSGPSTACKHKVKDILMGNETKSWYIEDHFTVEMLCRSSVGSSNKLTPIFFK